MLMTETAATKKWCPQVRALGLASDGTVLSASNRVAADDGTGSPRLVDQPAFACCIGSRCMSWRWAGWATRSGVASDPFPHDRASPRLGFCGLGRTPYLVVTPDDEADCGKN